jgi:hypothetical protein
VVDPWSTVYKKLAVYILSYPSAYKQQISLRRETCLTIHILEWDSGLYIVRLLDILLPQLQKSSNQMQFMTQKLFCCGIIRI